ncbi:FkbM family methyltransferase [Anabaenopsis elenkinii]|uniref:FkbM family methyltransferase n=1 Tax=Anabaenopsis elenkinii CCIBt3563 TaxID=2779889 RepID=A0A7S6REE6_9CYAN|nr:FkbM family methyltransferase [Anabaenopsis elenkinii]QOV23336.1 FkbM family methyltransferase [Anabaenopsis elenkinii CCIBt3563]
MKIFNNNLLYLDVKFYGLIQAIQNLGLLQTIHFLFQRFIIGRFYPGVLKSKFSRYPLYYRWNNCDLHVFRQIFINREYSPLDKLTNVGLVIDCGANIGYSSAYFLTIFPQCEVIAVEPDKENFALMQKNLAFYGNRVRMLNSGVWSHCTDLIISDTEYRGGLPWSRQVKEVKDKEGSIQGIDISSLLNQSGFDRISVLKIDIEGAEGVIFSDNYEQWLDKVDVIAIEIHDDSIFGNCTQIVHTAISNSGIGFSKINSGELLICIKK